MFIVFLESRSAYYLVTHESNEIMKIPVRFCLFPFCSLDSCPQKFLVAPSGCTPDIIYFCLFILIHFSHKRGFCIPLAIGSVLYRI